MDPTNHEGSVPAASTASGLGRLWHDCHGVDARTMERTSYRGPTLGSASVAHGRPGPSPLMVGDQWNCAVRRPAYSASTNRRGPR